jgi:hypothetical protein
MGSRVGLNGRVARAVKEAVSGVGKFGSILQGKTGEGWQSTP